MFLAKRERDARRFTLFILLILWFIQNSREGGQDTDTLWSSECNELALLWLDEISTRTKLTKWNESNYYEHCVDRGPETSRASLDNLIVPFHLSLSISPGMVWCCSWTRCCCWMSALSRSLSFLDFPFFCLIRLSITPAGLRPPEPMTSCPPSPDLG